MRKYLLQPFWEINYRTPKYLQETHIIYYIWIVVRLICCSWCFHAFVLKQDATKKLFDWACFEQLELKKHALAHPNPMQCKNDCECMSVIACTKFCCQKYNKEHGESDLTDILPWEEDGKHGRSDPVTSLFATISDTLAGKHSNLLIFYQDFILW